MSIEIDIVSGDASWPAAKPLLEAIWPPAQAAQRPWGDLAMAHPTLRVLLETDEGLVCHIGLHFRTVLWKGRKHPIGAVGSVATRADCRRLGYASIALNAAIQTIRDYEAVDFALLFCEPHNFAFYEARHWHRFEGAIMADQPGGRIRFDALTPFVFDLRNAPRNGAIDLCGLPW